MSTIPLIFYTWSVLQPEARVCPLESPWLCHCRDTMLPKFTIFSKLGKCQNREPFAALENPFVLGYTYALRYMIYLFHYDGIYLLGIIHFDIMYHEHTGKVLSMYVVSYTFLYLSMKVSHLCIRYSCLIPT